MEAKAPSTIEPTMAAVPLVMSQGSSGMNAPRAKVKNEASAAWIGEPNCCGVDAQLLAGVGLERQLRVRHDLIRHVGGHGRVDAPFHVHAAQFFGLPLGALLQRLALHIDLSLEQLALGTHGEVLPRRHGEGSSHQPGHAGQADDPGAWTGSGDAQDQRHVGDQPVADPEDGGASTATPYVPVLMEGIVFHSDQRSEGPSALGRRRFRG